MCGMSTQQWPNTGITLFERTRQSAWLDAETTPVDQKWVNPCVLKHHLFWGSSATKKSAKKARKCSLRRATNVTFLKFRGWCRETAGFDGSINSGPQILRTCLLHWCEDCSICPVVPFRGNSLQLDIALSAWMLASSFAGSPLCVFALTRNVAAPAVDLFRSSSIASSKTSASRTHTKRPHVQAWLTWSGWGTVNP